MEKLSRLQEHYLESLDALQKFKSGAIAAERDRLRRLATDAEAKVEAAFKELQDGGHLRELSARYRDNRKFNPKIVPWPLFVLDEKRRMIRALALEQKQRARRGVRV